MNSCYITDEIALSALSHYSPFLYTAMVHKDYKYKVCKLLIDRFVGVNFMGDNNREREGCEIVQKCIAEYYCLPGGTVSTLSEHEKLASILQEVEAKFFADYVSNWFYRR